MSRAYVDGGIYNMKLSTLVLFGLSVLFTLTAHADDGDFSDDSLAPPPATDISTPPSAAGEFNSELTDAVGDEEPKVPQPEMEPSKPSVASPAPAEPAKKKEKKAAKKEKVGKKDKAAKKDKAGKKDKASKKSKAGKKDKMGKKDKASKKDKAGKKAKKAAKEKAPPAM